MQYYTDCIRLPLRFFLPQRGGKECPPILQWVMERNALRLRGTRLRKNSKSCLEVLKAIRGSLTKIRSSF